MEQKINIAKLLKDCPKGMELDCTIYKNLTLIEVRDDENILFPICCVASDGKGNVYGCSFTNNGCLATNNLAKCVIFPKGKTTWEGFIPPCKFKDGDIITCTNRVGSFVAIFKEKASDTLFKSYVVTSLCKHPLFKINSDASDYSHPRFATEEEKEKLFQAIKANGYEWNAKTKTLKKLAVPKFKRGDIIQDADGYKVKITGVYLKDEIYTYESVIAKGVGSINFKEQDNWELVLNKFDITTLKPFESKVLVRDKNSEEWRGQFFSHYENNSDRPYVCIGVVGLCEYKQCIPYEDNEHLLGTTDDCSDYYKTWKK